MLMNATPDQWIAVAFMTALGIWSVEMKPDSWAWAVSSSARLTTSTNVMSRVHCPALDQSRMSVGIWA